MDSVDRDSSLKKKETLFSPKIEKQEKALVGDPET